MSLELFSLKGKTALITGATNGMGQSMAAALYEAGASVIFTHRPSTDPEITRHIILKSNPSSNAVVDYVECDFERVQLNAVNEKIVIPALAKSPNGEIDILVNNAGITHRSPVAQFPSEQHLRVLHVNLNVPIELTKAVGARMISRGIKGKIIFTASLNSFRVRPGLAAYSASKGGILQFAKVCAVEWGAHGINVNSIGPGYIKTNMTQRMAENESDTRWILESTPQKRWGTPEDLKGPIVFLSSRASDFVNGDCLMVDGGWMAQM